MHSCAQKTELARAATRPHSAWLRRRLARWPRLAAHSAPHAKKATRNARPACRRRLSLPVLTHGSCYAAPQHTAEVAGQLMEQQALHTSRSEADW